MKNNQKKFHISIVIVFCIFAILAGKLVRHTVMRETLVVPGIGWQMVNKTNNKEYRFGFTIRDHSTDDAASSATSNAGYIFEKINFLNLASSYYGYEILISVIWNLLIFWILIKLKKSYTFSEMIFILISVSVLNIFDFTIAKEPVQMLYFILMFLVLKSNKTESVKYIFCLFIYLLCFITYRNYYILMAAFMIFVYTIYKLIISKISKINLKHILLILLSIFLCYFTFLNIAKIVDVTSYNELLRVRLRTSSAASDMRAIFKSNNLILFSLDYILMLVRMLVPIELVKLGPKYAIYTIYQVIISIIIILNIKNINKISIERRVALYIYIAFLMGSAAFEPDFGSWIRHEAVLFPILLIICGFNERNIKNEKKFI